MTGGIVQRVIEPRPRDLGGFAVRRLLPAAQRQAVGPFQCFDHFGPVTVLLATTTTCGRTRTSAWRP